MSTEHECEERKVEVLLLFALKGGFLITRNVHRSMSLFFKVNFSGFCSPTSGTDLVLDP